MDAAAGALPGVASGPHSTNELNTQLTTANQQQTTLNENGLQTEREVGVKCEATKGPESTTTVQNHSNAVDVATVKAEDKPKGDVAPEKVLITICSADRKKKMSFMSLPTRKDVVEKAHKYGLTGNNIVLESNGCEICEDEVLQFAAKEKLLLMLLAESDEYVILPPPSPLNRSERASSSVDPSLYASHHETDETLSLASVTPSNSKASAMFKDFIIPWSKVPNDIMKLLRGKNSLGKRLNTLGNILVDALRERSAQIPIRVFRQVAQQAAEKYPDSLLEKDREGQLIATSPQSLISKMINRNNALNRPQKRTSGSSGSGTFEIHISTKKRKSGCASVVTSNGANLALNRDLEHKKELLISCYRGSSSIDAATITEYMKVCFPLQRSFFNNSEKIPDIKAIKDNWPYIFNKEMLYQHFELLMSIDPRVLEKRFAGERERIFKFFKTSKNKKVNSLLEENNINVIRGLAYHFNEDPDYIFKQFENGPLSKETLQHINPTNAPWVALVNTPSAVSDGESKTEAMVYIEGQIMASFSAHKDTDFPDVIAQLICYYYTFNMMYPKEANHTLEFIVIYFLQNAPEQTRNSKNFTGNSKYNQLISKLANIVNG
ncbi:uncharacterized protein Dwil_GK21066 [Drosophila willistoni]|uniref:CIDE-N domain-containing protein n=1 Tax=Drosophila willistoni TaxID=7260 RepID=B4N796_DROWI|nr:uncharacterized protein Dwil_GK21066 [Drosophila willistoni]